MIIYEIEISYSKIYYYKNKVRHRLNDSNSYKNIIGFCIYYHLNGRLYRKNNQLAYYYDYLNNMRVLFSCGSPIIMWSNGNIRYICAAAYYKKKKNISNSFLQK